MLSNNSTGNNGNSWLVQQLARLAFINTSAGPNNPQNFSLVSTGTGSRWFNQLQSNVAQSQFSGYETLTYDPTNGEFVLATKSGRGAAYYDNTSGVMSGKLKAVVDKAGNSVSPTYDSSGRITSFAQGANGQSCEFSYLYVTSGPNTGMLEEVDMLVNGLYVRRAVYQYYSGEAGGNLNDLKNVFIETYNSGSQTWSVRSSKHYRYYVPGESGGFTHGLKYALRGTAYQQMVAAGFDPATVPDALLATYANYYFEYDSSHRVTKEALNGGQRIFTFNYWTNPSPGSGPNSWKTQTIEMLPDGNENRVYTNSAGQILLKILQDNSIGQPWSGFQWYSYTQYNSQFRIVQQANSAAVASVVEPTTSNLNLVVTLKTNDGLITGQTYYTTTDPSTGAVAGYLQSQTVQQGTAGTPIPTRAIQYTSQTASGQTIYPLQSLTVYPNTDGSNPSVTSYAYTWYNNPTTGQPTFQSSQKTTTMPAVPTAQNGQNPPVAGVRQTCYDINGRLTWLKDERGAITYRAYDPSTGALQQLIEDVNTSLMSNVPAGWNTVAGWGQHLITDYVNDSLGRPVQVRSPWHEIQLHETDTVTTAIRRVKFSAYNDAAHEVRQAVGYMTGDDPTADFQIVGPVTVTQANDNGRIVDYFQAVRCCNSGPLTTDELFEREKWSRWTHNICDTWGRVVVKRLYCRIPFLGDGTKNENYLETLYSRDVMNRRIRTFTPSDTVRRVVYETRGLVVSNWTGTNDLGATAFDPTGGATPGNNMVCVNVNQYDNGLQGFDGNLTEVVLPVDSTFANDLITTLGYDFRNNSVLMTSTDGTTTWNTATTYDNLNRSLQSSRSVAGGHLINQSRTYYDVLGRVYQRQTDGVNPGDGSVTNTLTSQNWYDLGANVIKASQAGATFFAKTVYDAINRPTVSYTASVPGTAGVPEGDDNDVSTDTVLEQNETSYDTGGNTVLSVRRQRFDTATGTGPLADVTTQPEARSSYTGYWPDALGRVRTIADFGTNGGITFVQPAVAPSRSDTILVTTNHYKDTGDATGVTDPMGLQMRWENDQAGRRIRLIENFVSDNLVQSRTSIYSWHPSGQLQQRTLVNSSTGNQVTRWIYGTTLNDPSPDVASNDLLRYKIYPESAEHPVAIDGSNTPYAQLSYTYNRQGQKTTFTDADGTVHTYAYDRLGRLLTDSVTALGPGLDNTVLQIGRAYEIRGMLASVTSYADAAGGTVVNEVAFTYDAFSNVIQEAQSHSGATTSGTPSIAYGYTDGSNNTMRRISTTYPSGQVLTINYGAANSVDDHLNRVTELDLGGNPLVQYSYVGLNWQVQIAYPSPAVELTYKAQDSEPYGDAGDPYNGYDRFGRTADIRWQTTAAGNAQLERIQYGFDRDSRRVWRKRLLTTELDDAYTYDGLGQVMGAALGNLNLNATAIAGIPTQQEFWTYDQTGNWQNYQLAVNPPSASSSSSEDVPDLDQTRVYDRGNRLTQIVGDPNPILLDQVGRMLQVPPDERGNWNNSLQLTWDAWARITEVMDASSGAVLGAYVYDGLSRRIMRTADGVLWHCYYSDQWRPLEERQNTATTPSAQYYWGVRHRDDLVRRDRAANIDGVLNETRYVLMDYYSPAAITDQDGSVTERYRFSAFGIRTILDPLWAPIPTSESDFEFAFQGQLLDTETGLLDFGYRYYSPSLGRWLSKDLIDTSEEPNLFAFVNNRPVNSYDILGLAAGVQFPCKPDDWLNCFGTCARVGHFCVLCYLEVYINYGGVQFDPHCICLGKKRM